MVKPLRHRQTKGAATAVFYLMPPAPHLDSTQSGHSANGIQGAVLVWIYRIEALLDDRKIFLCR
jgi:hypothetical protein